MDPDARLAPAVDLASLADHLPGAVVAVDGSGVVLHWSPGAAQLYGWSAEEALGRSVRDLMLAGQDELADEVVATTGSGRQWRGEFLTRRKDGTRLPVYVSNAALRAADGTSTGVVGVSLDMTAHRDEMVARARRSSSRRSRGPSGSPTATPASSRSAPPSARRRALSRWSTSS